MSSFAISKVYTSKNGAPYTPTIGETFTLTAEFDVTGTPKNAYTVAFTMADRYKPTPMFDLTPGHKTVHADFDLPALDGTIPWLVEIDPFNLADAADPTKSWIPLQFPDIYSNGGGQIVLNRRPDWPTVAAVRKLKGSFSPIEPANAIEYYDPRWLLATQGSFTTFSPGKIDRLAMMMGDTTTDSWQKVLLSTCRVDLGGGMEPLTSQPVEGPTLYPVYLFDRKNVANGDFSMSRQSVLEVRNQRVSATKLRTATWPQLDALQAIDIFKAYTSPETVVESNNKKIGDFVVQTLGANYRTKLSPYDAARTLFQAVLAKTVYYFPAPGQPDKRPDTAAKMLDAGFGDCGGFSILLVALYRNIGFPARTACGAWMGQDNGHCWCEMWFPGHGWMVSDGSAGNGQCEDGSFAYYFGNIPDLNARYACMRGNTFAIGDITTSWLQGPDGPLVWGSAAATTDSHTAVLEISQAEAMSLVDAANSYAAYAQLSMRRRPPDERTLEFVRCPCAAHGGFSPSLRARVAQF